MIPKMDYLYQDKLQCNVKLLNKDLWDSFYKLNTEMIITKPGRRMFPSMRVQVSDLDPHKNYCFLVEMVPVTKCRYRYSAATGWAPAGSEEAHSPNRFYVHPDSPAPGEHWMSQAVSFGRLKLTNMSSAPAGHVVMASMHKYQPRIHVIQTSELRAVFDYAPKALIDFPETQFIAVTAYQNDKMTKMKIDHNPFAKGFRETGQSKCKRKRQRMELEKQERDRENSLSAAFESSDEIIEVVDEDEVQRATKRRASPPLLEVSSDSGLSDCDSPVGGHPAHHHQQQYAQRAMYPFAAPAFYQYPLSLYPYSPVMWQPAYPSPSLSSVTSMGTPPPPPAASTPQDLTKKSKEEPKVEEVRQFTDFSIRAITGIV